jgi:hypothetical protein
MGKVYEAMDLELGRIALKTIRPEIAANPEMLARFKKEVQLALKISGPHVCRIRRKSVTKIITEFLYSQSRKVAIAPSIQLKTRNRTKVGAHTLSGFLTQLRPVVQWGVMQTPQNHLVTAIFVNICGAFM